MQNVTKEADQALIRDFAALKVGDRRRFLIAGHVQAQGFGLEPEPIRLVVEAGSLERACSITRGIYPDFQLEQARLATVFEVSGG